MKSPSSISQSIKKSLADLREFSEGDCHAEDLADCFGYLKARIDEAGKIKATIQAKLIEQGELVDNGDTVESDTFRVLLSMRAKSGKLDKTKLETKYPEVYADVWTRGYGSTPVLTTKNVG